MIMYEVGSLEFNFQHLKSSNNCIELKKLKNSRDPDKSVLTFVLNISNWRCC